MIFDLLEKKIEKIDSITTIDIDPDDTADVQKIMIESPTFREINGMYHAWKYSTYGYVWRKETANSNVFYILFYKNKSILQAGLEGLKDHIYIYKSEKQMSTTSMMLMAWSGVYEKNFMEYYKWMVFDENLTKMIRYNNIKLSIK